MTDWAGLRGTEEASIFIKAQRTTVELKSSQLGAYKSYCIPISPNLWLVATSSQILKIWIDLRPIWGHSKLMETNRS